MDLFTAIHGRRSQTVLTGPAPNAEDIDSMLSAAMAAPEHGRQTPWRFVILEGEGKDAFADVLEKAYRARTPGPVGATRIMRERGRLARAPLVIAAACAPGAGDRIPRHERLAATAAATQNLLLAATALGYGSMWRTGRPAEDARVKQALGLTADDDIVAFVHLGTVDGDHSMPARTAVPTGDVSWVWPPPG